MMKEIQIPKKNFARSSESGAKKLKESVETKNRKFTEKRQSAIFSEFSMESTKDPMEFMISSAISDSDAESFMQGSCIDELSAPEICLLTDDSPASAMTNKDFHIDVSSVAEMQSLREEISELKKLMHSVDTSGERSWIDGVVTAKFRVVVLSFLIWAALAAIVVFFKSGEEVAYYGPLPT